MKGDRFYTTDSTVVFCKHLVVSALANSGPNELDDIVQAFDDKEKHHYSGVLCAIDGCHMEKEAP